MKVKKFNLEILEQLKKAEKFKEDLENIGCQYYIHVGFNTVEFHYYIKEDV